MSQTSSLKHSIYEYNPQNRMVRSRVIDDEARTIASTRYGYDPLGRRTLVQDNGITTLRTLYDGLGFDVVKESPVYANGGFTDTYNIGIQYEPAGRATGERYRYLDDGVSATSEKYQYIEDSSYQTVSSRYTGERTMLYANGSPVAINRSSGTRGYLGTDILGSTRSVTDNHGVQESFYDYDIFGSPITGNYTTGADYGYLGKPYDSITGLYNYGYRDYSPQSVRFTTVDPIRDGSNWFAYVNNDPVNYVDLWGLEDVYFIYVYTNTEKDQKMKEKERESINDDIKYLEENGFSVKVIEQGTKNDIEEALENPEVDLIVTSGHGYPGGYIQTSNGDIFGPDDVKKLNVSERLDRVIFQNCFQGGSTRKTTDNADKWNDAFGNEVDVVAWQGTTSVYETKRFNGRGFFDRQENSLRDYIESIVEEK